MEEVAVEAYVSDETQADAEDGMTPDDEPVEEPEPEEEVEASDGMDDDELPQ